jgi:integrase
VLPFVASFSIECEPERMGTRQLRILPYTGKRAYQYYIDGLKVNGKRQRLFFEDEKSAKAKLKELTKKTRKEGEDALALSHDFRVLAAKCSERLKPFGKTLWDATEFYLEHLERTKDSVFVSVAAADYQESKKRAKLSATHLDDIRLRLGRFVAAFGNRPIKGIVAGEIESWLHELALSPQSINNYRAIVRAFFSYALKRELVEKNPVALVDKVKLVDKAPEIFTPKQLADLLAAADPPLLPALALQAFAGLRTAEVLRLEWSEVDLVRGFVTVAAHKSKTARRRLIPIAQNLGEWLRPYAQMSGPVYSTKTRNYHADIEALRRSIGLPAWPNNGLRHSFASYHLAFHQDAAALMLQMGHTTTREIFEAYRELVRPDEALEYWNIRPQITPGSVIPMMSVTLNRSG